MKQPSSSDPINIFKLTTITIGALLILASAFLIAYRYSQSRQGGIVLPGGVTYLGSTPTIPLALSPTPTTAPLSFTTDATTSYKEFFGAKYPYVFSYPETLPLVVFPNDPLDSVAISWGNLLPQQNILLNMEFMADRDNSDVYKTKKEFVENWWQYFSGLKGVASVQPFTNLNGLKGYKAQYINLENAAPNVDVFFEVPGRSDIMIHLANGILDQTIFDRIIDSVKWIAPT
ncbi:hypothetical protein A3D78_05320 [Candidatus Gottesmanbacteria bacterium RIFCSPHIGHO2_02_FULL_39_14]|uniref:Uncharacterized protein n=1 Tax=Candidatus Gottesmanbacteria bacterium RIFCSPHIGHO2_02_FULL_39_14 TaxID=1798383 RepID=A0A1F5ZZ71_9BACT|nr:MAG: hypothetical protein A3D78_05320 [Candidatus Gottesmanbacteria bacterium RIFCSPHIGHO2_02_FULL_39_14]